MTPPSEQVDVVALAVLVITAAAGAQVAQVAAPYVVIIASALVGSAVALMRRPPSSRLWALGFVAVMVLVTFFATGAIAYVIEVGLDHWLGIQIASRWFLVPVAGGIAAVGADWPDVARWVWSQRPSWLGRRTGSEA